MWLHNTCIADSILVAPLRVAAGSGKLDAEIASAISSPAIITCQAKDQSLADLKRKILLKKALLDDHKVRRSHRVVRCFVRLCKDGQLCCRLCCVAVLQLLKKALLSDYKVRRDEQ